MSVEIRHGDCRELLADEPENSFDACVTDPPYHLTSIVKRFGAANAAPAKSNGPSGVYGRASKGFMGKTWDGGDVAFRPETWAAVLRVLKPGAYLLAFGGTRTYHRLACAIEDAGFEIRDTIMWLYGSGFPKSHDVSKAIDRSAPRVGMFDAFAAHFAERRRLSGTSRKEIAELFLSKTGGITGCVWNWENGDNVPTRQQWTILQPLLGLSDEFLPLIERIEAEREVIGQRAAIPGVAFSGIGPREIDITAPATEAARQWQGWGTALKPACELIVVARKPLDAGTVAANCLKWGTGAINVDACRVACEDLDGATRIHKGAVYEGVHDGYQRPGKSSYTHKTDWHPAQQGRWPANVCHDGSPEVLAAFARFGNAGGGYGIQGGECSGKIYARPGRHDVGRVVGHGDTGTAARFFFCGKATAAERVGSHPTVKPVALMEWLVRMVTPPGGRVLDLFGGTGSTGVACDRLGFDCVLMEQDAQSVADAHEKLRRMRARRLIGPVDDTTRPLPGQMEIAL